MHRVDTDTAQVDKHGAGKNGFTGGTPPLVLPTIPGHEIFDAFQEELANAIELAGITLVKGTHTQLHAAILSIANVRAQLLGRNFYANLTVVAPSGTPAQFNAVTFDPVNNIWVAVGNSGALQNYNPQNGTWGATTPGSAYVGHINGVCTNGTDTLVFVGASGEIQTSPDGATWTHRAAAASYAGTFRSVVFAEGLFVAVGSGGEIQTSPTGTTWTRRTAAASYAGDFNAITHAQGTFVAVGSGPAIQTSPDGITWTSRTVPTVTNPLTGIAGGDSRFVVVSADENATLTSDDLGATWAAHASTFSGLGCRATAHLNGAFIACLSWDVYTSDDGVTWDRHANALRMSNAFGIGVSDSRVMIVGVNATGRTALSLSAM